MRIRNGFKIKLMTLLTHPNKRRNNSIFFCNLMLCAVQWCRRNRAWKRKNLKNWLEYNNKFDLIFFLSLLHQLVLFTSQYLELHCNFDASFNYKIEIHFPIIYTTRADRVHIESVSAMSYMRFTCSDEAHINKCWTNLAHKFVWVWWLFNV